ncbi:MAG: beta-ketoacyl-ACP synthase [Candidatus Accumulibacter sp.]|jgi:3-oxoacyl-[acyl-carrier-protein] synthase-1|nr:beta-ketoacyl-ACP synthase [Accumulibacter sp.]
MNVYLRALGMCNVLGNTLADITQRLFAGDRPRLPLEEGWSLTGKARVGRVCGELPRIPSRLSGYSCRAARLLLLAFQEIAHEVESVILRFGNERIGVVLGTSTSSISEGESAMKTLRAKGRFPDDYAYVQQEFGMPAVFLASCLGISGPAYCVSTACSSSAKAFISARGLLRQGVCDAVIVGGVDALSQLAINGFSALELTTEETGNPMSKNRKGINIGEGATLFLMTKEGSDIQLFGAGESSDAHHISAPHPEGKGAEAAMRAALADAKLRASDVDYLNMHATGTLKNDEMESFAVNRVFPDGVAVSGTKSLTGHLLGTAGATEIGFCWLALKDGRLPVHVWDGERDPKLPPLKFVETGERFRRNSSRICMSSSFAFGGNNVCLLIGDSR